MLKIDLYECPVEIDTELTKAWYDNANNWDCECEDCRNFLRLASKRALPANILEILDMLCIPPEKATYVCLINSDKNGHRYHFSYRIAGRILDEDDLETIANNSMERICCHNNYPYGAPGFPEPHFDLDFWEYLT